MVSYADPNYLADGTGLEGQQGQPGGYPGQHGRGSYGWLASKVAYPKGGPSREARGGGPGGAPSSAGGGAGPAGGGASEYVASVQFMITRAMREELSGLGYSDAAVDAMKPSRAAEILAQRTPADRSS